MAGIDESSWPRAGGRSQPECTDAGGLNTARDSQPRDADPQARQAVIRLPPLPPDDALRIVHLLERIQSAIWEAHGDAMGELLVSHYTDHHGPPEPSDDALLRSLDQDGDLPF